MFALHFYLSSITVVIVFSSPRPCAGGFFMPFLPGKAQKITPERSSGVILFE